MTARIFEPVFFMTGGVAHGAHRLPALPDHWPTPPTALTTPSRTGIVSLMILEPYRMTSSCRCLSYSSVMLNLFWFAKISDKNTLI